jgi:hypothetical protein
LTAERFILNTTNLARLRILPKSVCVFNRSPKPESRVLQQSSVQQLLGSFVCVEALEGHREIVFRQKHFLPYTAPPTQGSVSTNLVQVYKALGGGWEIRDDRNPVDLLPAAMKDEMRERTDAWEGVLR